MVVCTRGPCGSFHGRRMVLRGSASLLSDPWEHAARQIESGRDRGHGYETGRWKGVSGRTLASIMFNSDE